MSVDHRVLRILASFDLEHPVRKPAELMKELGVSRASIYRDLAALEGAGMLERVAGRGYVLGPLIVELDRQIRLADPLLLASGTLLRRLSQDSGGVVLLCRVHASKVLCIHQEVPPGDETPVSYERGRAMPLYRGATSRVILAQLSDAELQRLWDRDSEVMAAAGLPDTLDGLLQALAPMKKERFCVTHSEVDAGIGGLAVPLMDGSRVLGSLSVVMPVSELSAARRQQILSRLFMTAGTIESRLEEERLRARNKK